MALMACVWHWDPLRSLFAVYIVCVPSTSHRARNQDSVHVTKYIIFVIIYIPETCLSTALRSAAGDAHIHDAWLG